MESHLIENEIGNLFSQIVLPLQFVHSQNVVHRDLKSQNMHENDFTEWILSVWASTLANHLLHTVHRSFSFGAVWWTFFTCKFLSHVVENSLLGHSGQGWILGAWRRLMWPSKSFTVLWQSGHCVFSAWSILKCRSNFCCPGKYWLQCWQLIACLFQINIVKFEWLFFDEHF